MDHAVRTHTDGDVPPRRERFASPKAFAVWTLGTWAWRVALLGVSVWAAVELDSVRVWARSAAMSLATGGRHADDGKGEEPR